MIHLQGYKGIDFIVSLLDVNQGGQVGLGRFSRLTSSPTPTSKASLAPTYQATFLNLKPANEFITLVDSVAGEVPLVF